LEAFVEQPPRVVFWNQQDRAADFFDSQIAVREAELVGNPDGLAVAVLECLCSPYGFHDKSSSLSI
jgi:hypothetical protein